MNCSRLFVLSFLTLISGSALAGNLTVNLSPSAAVTAGAQWRVDGGNWRNSGATVKNLSNATHTVDYKAVTGWMTPASTSVTLTNNVTTTVNGTYVQPAALAVTLTPSSGQWRVDGGAWRNSGTTATGLTAGAHTISYNALSNYNSPATETVTLPANQTTSISRSYTAVAALTVTLTPSNASWQVDGGSWQSSGATVTGLTPGAHTIAYSTVAGMLPMASETVNLPGAQTTSLSRSYTAEARLTVNLTPSTGSWQLDSGVWRASGATATGVTPGTHTISYSGLSAMIAPPTESITLAAGENASISRSHTPAGYIFVMLNPTTAQWRVDGGAWRASHTSTGLIAEGPHLLEYSSLAGKVTPAAETVNVVAGQNLQVSKFYASESFLIINLTPSAGQWRVDGGVWHASGERVEQLTATGHTIDYTSLEGYAALPAETVVLYAGQTTTLSRTYTLPPARLTVNLSDPDGWWQIDSSGWRNSGQTATNLTPGSHTISYLNTAAALAPAPETLTLQPNEVVTISRDYTPAGQVRVTLNPSAAQWRIDGGEWRVSGISSGLIAAGTHTLEYSAVATKATPPTEPINIVAGQTLAISRTYAAESLLTITLTPAIGQWRVDGGAWRNSGEQVGQLAGGNHTVDYASLASYVSPATETVSLSAGQTTTLTRTYTIPLTVNLSDPNGSWQADTSGWRNSGQTLNLAPGDHTISYLDTAAGIAPASETVTLQAGAVTISRNYTPAGKVSVTLDPGAAQWRVDGGTWRASAADSGLMAEGPHFLEYSSVAERITPAAETVNIVAGQTLQVSKVYAVEASLTINLTPSSGQWRINGGGWHNSGERVTQLTAGAYTVDYTSVDGYSVLPAETVLLDSGDSKTLSRTYTLLPARLTVNLSDSGGQWRADNSGWHNSGETIDLAPGSHTISYLNTATALAPASETLTLQSNQEVTISRDYTPAGQVRVILNLTTAQWRVDGGIWRTSGTYSGLLAAGTHTLEYHAFPGKVTPPSETITIVAGQDLTVSRTYAQEYFLTITLTPAVGGKWRVDGGAWRNSGEQAGQLAEGSHSIEYSEVSGYLAPLAETTFITPYGGTNLTRSYSRPSSLTVTVNPAEGQWRINNGPWQASGATLTGLRPVYYQIQFTSVPGYFDVAEEWIGLGENENKSVTYTLTPHGSVTTTLTPGSGTWRLNGGEWQASGATIGALSAGDYTIDYSPVAGMETPPRETFFLSIGEQKTLSRSYGASPSLTVTLTPEVGQWRVDGGAWQTSGSNIPNLVPGAHLIEYTDAQGYIAPPAETFSLSNHQQASLTRVYRDASMAYLNVNVVPKRFAELGLAKWRVDGGVWNASGETAAVSPGSHTLEFQPVDGLDVPAPTTVTTTVGTVETLEASYYMPHRLRFFLQWDLVSGLATAELQARLSQYAAHLQTIWERESFRRFIFNPATDISIVWAQPFTWPATPPLPEYGFEVWAYADAAGANPSGSNGGFPAFDSSGAAGVGDMHWTQIYDPSTLAAGSTELSEYWKQIDTLTRELERVFGAGLGGYASARLLPDLTGVAPLYTVDYLTAADPFWNAHSDFWRDPLLGSAWNNYRIDNPTALPALLGSVRFSATSRAIIDGCYRNAAWASPLTTVPDLSHVRVTVVNANTRQPITGATVRMWHRPTSWGSPGAEEWVQPIFGTPGTFDFSWTGNTQWSPFNESDNAKLLKAYAPGYQPKAQWEWLYDGQRLKTVDNLDIWEITVALDPAP